MAIPKIIHQTVRSHDNLDKRLSENIDLLKSLNPGWAHRLHEDKDCRNFIGDVYGASYLKAFDSINADYGAAKADLFRYLLMYETGGVYLDIKSSCHVPLDTVLESNDEYILSQWTNGFGHHSKYDVESEYQQWHVIARPKHPYLKEVIRCVMENIENYDPRLHGVGKIGVLRLSGPIAYTKAIMPIVSQHAHRFVNTEDCGLVYSLFVQEGGRSKHSSVVKSYYRKSKRPVVRVSREKYLKYMRHRLLASFAKRISRAASYLQPGPAKS